MADPAGFSVQDAVTYGGMLIGGAVAAFLLRMGWKKPPSTGDSEMVIHGQAAITDMAPVKDLLKHLDLLAIEIKAAATNSAAAAAALRELTATANGWIDERRQEAEVARRVKEGVEDRLTELERVTPRSLPRKP